MRKRRRGDAAKDLRRLARLFREEIGKREWGKQEFLMLVAESAAAREKVAPGEWEAVRRALSMLDRTESLRQGALAAIEILEEGAGGAIPLPVVRDVARVFREQAGLAVADTFAALLASVGRAPRRSRASFQAEASRLTALRPSVSDLKASLAAISAVSPSRKRSGSLFEASLRDALAAALFLERAVGQVEELVSASGTRSAGRAPLVGIMEFVARCAAFTKTVARIRLGSAGGKQ